MGEVGREGATMEEEEEDRWTRFEVCRSGFVSLPYDKVPKSPFFLSILFCFLTSFLSSYPYL